MGSSPTSGRCSGNNHGSCHRFCHDNRMLSRATMFVMVSYVRFGRRALVHHTIVFLYRLRGAISARCRSCNYVAHRVGSCVRVCAPDIDAWLFWIA